MQRIGHDRRSQCRRLVSVLRYASSAELSVLSIAICCSLFFNVSVSVPLPTFLSTRALFRTGTCKRPSCLRRRLSDMTEAPAPSHMTPTHDIASSGPLTAAISKFRPAAVSAGLILVLLTRIPSSSCAGELLDEFLHDNATKRIQDAHRFDKNDRRERAIDPTLRSCKCRTHLSLVEWTVSHPNHGLYCKI
jgi:hypothetical protein